MNYIATWLWSVPLMSLKREGNIVLRVLHLSSRYIVVRIYPCIASPLLTKSSLAVAGQLYTLISPYVIRMRQRQVFPYNFMSELAETLSLYNLE